MKSVAWQMNGAGDMARAPPHYCLLLQWEQSCGHQTAFKGSSVLIYVHELHKLIFAFIICSLCIYQMQRVYVMRRGSQEWSRVARCTQLTHSIIPTNDDQWIYIRRANKSHIFYIFSSNNLIFQCWLAHFPRCSQSVCGGNIIGKIHDRTKTGRSWNHKSTFFHFFRLPIFLRFFFVLQMVWLAYCRHHGGFIHFTAPYSVCASMIFCLLPIIILLFIRDLFTSIDSKGCFLRAVGSASPSLLARRHFVWRR